MRKFSRKPPKTITSKPDERIKEEPELAFEMFKVYLLSNGELSFAEIGSKFNRKADTVRRYSGQWRWKDRLQLHQALNNAPETPAEAPTSAVKPTKADQVIQRIESVLEVSEASFKEASDIHRRLFDVAQQAANRLSADDIQSISELSQIVKLTTDLSKVKSELTAEIAGVQELARAVNSIRKKANNG